MATPNVDIKKRCQQLVDDMFNKGKTFSGKPLSKSIKALIAVEGDKNNGRVIVPYWFSVVQNGRGPRKATQTQWTTFQGVQMSAFQLAIYNWMEKYSRFESATPKGKINEAKGVAWYINKYGDKHFRAGAYIDIYDTLIKQLVKDIEKEISSVALTITSQYVTI
jgi:hypothetical protein